MENKMYLWGNVYPLRVETTLTGSDVSELFLLFNATETL